MKILFAGPTLYGIACADQVIAGTGILCRPPAAGGDIARAVLDGATTIGLVDGRYEDVAAPWHKEILFALSRGVRVYGAASMGALRAAECAAFGMVPVGRIAARYLEGELTDDAAVAQIHGPPELGCVPLSEALVNVEATIAAALESKSIARAEADELLASARSLYFKDRTYPAVVDDAALALERRKTALAALAAARRDVKRDDALALIEAMRTDEPSAARSISWSFCEPTAWRAFIATISAEASRARTATGRA